MGGDEALKTLPCSRELPFETANVILARNQELETGHPAQASRLRATLESGEYRTFDNVWYCNEMVGDSGIEPLTSTV